MIGEDEINEEDLAQWKTELKERRKQEAEAKRLAEMKQEGGEGEAQAEVDDAVSENA